MSIIYTFEALVLDLKQVDYNPLSHIVKDSSILGSIILETKIGNFVKLSEIFRHELNKLLAIFQRDAVTIAKYNTTEY